MNKRRFLFSPALACTLFISCEQLPENSIPDTEVPIPLEISVKASDGINTRGIITGTSLDDGSKIGVTLCDISEETYQGTSYENILYTASGSGSSQEWKADSPIMVANTPGTLYGYYPYSDKVTNISKIAITATSENQIDYLYATPVKDLTKANPSASVVMNHALAAVRLVITKGTYTGAGKLTEACVSGADIATSAMLDARTGTLSEIDGYSTEIAPVIEPFNISENDSQVDILVVPCCSAGQSMKVSLTIDGNIYTTEIPDVSIEQGKMTECRITVNDGEVFVTSVAVTAWKQTSGGSQIVQKDFKVSFAGDTSGLSFSNDVDEEGNVTILAVPYISEDAEAKPVTITGSATLEQSVDEDTGILTIKLSDIASDVDVNFNGVYLWITLTHNITDISAPTKIYYYAYNNPIERVTVDGVDIDTDTEHQFETTGEHTVKIAFSKYKSVPSNFCYSLKTVTQATFPEGVESIGSWAFIGVSSFKKVSLPSTLKSMGYQVFERTGLESCIIPDGCSMSYGVFDECRSLTYAKLPADMTTIPSGTFQDCSKLENIDLPEAYTHIESRAFSGTAIKKFEFPDVITVIEEGLLSNCMHLEEIRLPASLKEIKERAFNNCPSLKRVIQADGSHVEGECIIPEGVTYLEEYTVCFNSPDMHTVVLPSTLETIGNKALVSPMLEKFMMYQTNPKYDIRNNSVVETATNTLIAGGTLGGTIHESVSVIGPHAFYDSEIEYIDLHAGVTEIQENAFAYSLPKQIISRALTPPALGTMAFQIANYRGTLKVPQEAIDAYRDQWMIDEIGYLGWSTARWGLVALADGE